MKLGEGAESMLGSVILGGPEEPTAVPWKEICQNETEWTTIPPRETEIERCNHAS